MPAYNEMLREYLEKEMARRQNENSPEYRKSLSDSAASERKSDREGRTDRVLASSLMKSAAQIGTYGGKTADTSAVDDMTKALGQGQTDYARLAKEDEASRAQRFGMDVSVYNHLSDKQQRQDAAAAAGKAREADLKHRADTLGETKRHNQAMEGKAAVGGKESTGSWSVASVPGDDGQPIMVNSKTGLTQPVPGAKPKVKETSPDQFKVAGFARRLEQAEDVFKDLGSQDYDRTGKMGAAYNAIAPSFAETDSYKANDQAERNFINAVLRRESGASISPPEFQSAEKQYFPRPGDPPELAEQKRLNRQQVFENLKSEAAGAYDKTPRIPGIAAKKKPEEGTATAAPASTAPAGKVRVVSPDGKSGTIPIEDLEDALKEGYQEVK